MKSETDKYVTQFIYRIFKKMILMNIFAKQRQTCRLRELMVMEGRVGERDRPGVWDGYVHTAKFKIENQQGPTVSHRELSSILCNYLFGKRKDVCVCIHIKLNHFAIYLKLTTLLINYSPM